MPNANKIRHSQWFKYPEDESTWEDEKHLRNATKHVAQFWSDLNLQKGGLDIGEIYAGPRYIGEFFIVLKFHIIIIPMRRDAEQYKMSFIQNEAVL